ncbi:Ribonuclease H-like superfamily [Arabidopsis thaliana x Arabidopsis arenosa]|uniref:Ribonuclease H-like superfamily n=1 Tax=Arabidopsis thaliana x Arabidopsis arenosa TaxID=1240361 RepID=A0A8T1YBG1_9BRAS|nr:Ribonuclease H-like superfamily [Arabidopsis thaliana x Arabidopsis arenosa]
MFIDTVHRYCSSTLFIGTIHRCQTFRKSSSRPSRSPVKTISNGPWTPGFSSTQRDWVSVSKRITPHRIKTGPRRYFISAIIWPRPSNSNISLLRTHSNFGWLLKKRYDHQKTVLLPQAKFDWKELRFQDYKSVDDYNSELFRIVSIMKLCGEEVSDNDLLEKTLSTFHTQNIVLQQQYRAMKHTLYENLLSCLLLAEKNNELLMRNSAQRPPGSAPVPDSRKESYNVQRDRSSDRGNGRGKRGRGNGRGNRHNLGYGSGKGRGISKPNRPAHPTNQSACTRCGMFNHWTKNCRTPKFHCDLYQKHGKAPAEANMAQQGEGNKESLLITKITLGHKQVLETIPALSTGLYYAKVSMIEANNALKARFQDYTIWHNRLGHPGTTMMRKLIQSSQGHTLRENRVFPQHLTCTACSQGKLITRPSPVKVSKETLHFLERIQGDICGPIHPPSGTFRYFMVLIDASTRWSYVCLLSSRNQAFARLLAQIIRLRAHFPNFPLKTIPLDNASEFTSQAFNDYCMAMGVTVEHPVAHVHTQNGLAESFIKRIQWIARPLLMRSKLPVSAWGHAVLHAAELIRIRPSSEHRYSPSQLLTGHEPDISHLKTFGCSVYVPIAPPHRTKMGPQRRMGIYVGFDSPTIIKYLEPTTGDLFKARYADCQFDESVYPDIPACNAPVRITVPTGQVQVATKSASRNKRGRPLGSKDKNLRKSKKGAIVETGIPNITDIDAAETHSNEPPEEVRDAESLGSEEINNDEISINYNMSGTQWNRKEVYLNALFAYKVALDITNTQEDLEPTSITQCTHRTDWLKWKEAINVELKSLKLRNVFGPIIRTPFNVKPVGHKWVFVRKRNELGEVVRYKARLVAQGFSQRPGIDYEETYSPVAHPLTSPMVVRSLGLDSDPLGPKKDDEEILGPEKPYLSAVGALMYLASHTRPDICFVVNLLARFSSCPTQRHWNGIKHLLRYLQGTKDLGLFYTNHNKDGLVGFADAGYLSDPHTAKSQTGYVFTHGGTAISWRSMKQTITTTSSNHAELLAIHEASRECVWLQSMTQHIRSDCGIDENKEPTVLYEDNAACIAQLKEGYIKGDRTKHILPKFFSTLDWQKDGTISVQQVRSSENSADLFTKSLPASTLRKLIQQIGMRRLRDLQ